MKKRTGSKRWGHLNRKSISSASKNLVSLCTGSDGVAKVSNLRQIIEDTGKRGSACRATELTVFIRLFSKSIHF